MATVEEIAQRLTADNHEIAVQLASVPERIRGYGHVKERHLAEARAQEEALRAAFEADPGDRKAAE